jgi:Rho GTPase-activating protein RGD1
MIPEIENNRLRHIRMHERVNELPDANYATLKYFLGHLHRYVTLLPVTLIVNERSSSRRINHYEAVNSMSIQNLAIVFGPTLFGQVISAASSNAQINGIADAAHQNKASEFLV